MCDRGVCEHPLQVALRDGDDIARPHGQNRQDHEHLTPVSLEPSEAVDQKAHEHGERGQLGRSSDEQSHRGGSPFVHIGNPHMERHRAQLEGDAHDHEYQPEDREKTVIPALRHELAQLVQIQRAADSVQDGDPI